MSILEAIVIAVVEGLTEFLPVSSTGHMIIAESFLGTKGDFVKLKTIACGYTFNEHFFGKTGINSLRVYLQVTNLYTLTNYTGSDPEISVNGNTNTAPGNDRNSAPQARTFTFGLNIGL